MSWLYSQALVEAFSEANCLDGTQSALLNGESTPQAYCAPDKMKGFSRLSRFGMTFKPLTDDLGAELLTLYLAAFPARTLALQEKAQESRESDQECGATWLGSLGKYDPDSRSWKTAQRSFLGDLEESLAIWPRSGMTAGGECWELPMLERIIKGIDSGLWRTPTVGMLNADRAKDPEYGQRKLAKGQTITLADQVKDSRMWPTPTAHNAKETNAPSEHNRNTPTLAAQAGGHLNPTWVEWLQGFPLGWTDLQPLAMPKSLCVQQQHGECLAAVKARG